MARNAAIFLDSFSGPLTDLKTTQRTDANALAVLAKHPRVSCWDMETLWVRSMLAGLTRKGLIAEDKNEPYPWLKFNLTNAGRAAINGVPVVDGETFSRRDADADQA